MDMRIVNHTQTLVRTSGRLLELVSSTVSVINLLNLLQDHKGYLYLKSAD